VEGKTESSSPSQGPLIGNQRLERIMSLVSGKNPLENQRHPISTRMQWTLVISGIVLFVSGIYTYGILGKHIYSKYFIIAAIVFEGAAFYYHSVVHKYSPEMMARRNKIRLFVPKLLFKCLIAFLVVLVLLFFVVRIILLTKAV